MNQRLNFPMKLRLITLSSSLILVFICFLASISGCRVQAGNPQADKPKNPGTVTIALADAPVDELSSIYVVVQGVAFAGAGAGRCLKDPSYGCADIDLTFFDFDEDTEVDLLTLSGGKSQTMPFIGEISAGIYEGLRLFLSPQKPVRGILKENGEEILIDFPLSPFGKKEFTIREEFDVEEGIENQILIHVDLRRSLKKRADGTFLLMPFTHVVPARIAGSLYGQVPSEVIRVCAYNVGGMRRHGRPPINLSDPHKQHSQLITGAPVVPSELKRPPLFDSIYKERFPGQPDLTVSCDNAESVSEIVDGQYELFHLPPVQYVLRGFRGDGTYIDKQVSEPLLPQERRLVDF
ncbi:MAG: hypothetical protein RJB13_1181 [Pseudomonadota bacterium]|jgi:hypothetical protein